jgi:hypothetical protein
VIDEWPDLFKGGIGHQVGARRLFEIEEILALFDVARDQLVVTSLESFD